MSVKKQQVHPLELACTAAAAAAAEAAKPDAESEELRRSKCTRYISYLVIFTLFETFVVLLCVITLVRIKSPKFRLRAVSIEHLNYSTNATSPSFIMRFNAKIAIKNSNFGHFKIKNGSITLAYRGDRVGDATISKARAKARSTKKMNVTVEVTSDHVSGYSRLAEDLKSGYLTLTSEGKLSGKVYLMKMVKRRRLAHMNCTIVINLVRKFIQDLYCL